MRSIVLLALVAVALIALPNNVPVRAASDNDEVDQAKVKQSVADGLKWVAKNQLPGGHWEANGGAYPATMTALAGMALMMEGSTVRDGKYAQNIRKAVDWFVARSQTNGLLGNPREMQEAARYIYGHGYGMLFLSQAFGEEDDAERRAKLEKVLTKAVEFSCKAQTKRGGWGYVSGTDGGGFDEGSTTITQLQGIRAARNAGIKVPKEVIENAQKYLKDATTQRGSILYSLANGHGEGGPALVAAAIAGGFSTGDYDSPLVKKWLTYCRTNLPLNNINRIGHDEYLHYYYAQALYFLGEDRYAKLFPDMKQDDVLTWSKYRKQKFNHMIKSQLKDGSWNTGNIGAVYTTAMYLTILQLDNGTLPIYQR